MPPRRSCFETKAKSLSPTGTGFQCHHGVPASQVSDAELEADFLVSMPPRRSCFRPSGVSSGCGIWCFNATTAFLLRLLAHHGVRVEMPFQCHHGVPASEEEEEEEA